ncbi:hypothetical protein B5X24_HaOG200945 [Helicoverpa armigera]|nr:hypothetical protein B5X24_HaOG200945 [Helicoverpa armigera]
MNITESKTICYFMKLYCICFSAVVIANFYFIEVHEKNIYSLIFVSIVEYALISSLSLIYGFNLFLNFFTAIKTNDRIIGFERMSLITRYSYLIIFVNSVMRYVITVSFGSTYIHSLLEHFFVFLAAIALDLYYVTIIILFALIQNRMKCLRLFLASNSVPICITARNNVANSIRNVRKSLVYYNNLLDYLEGLGQQLQYMVHFLFIYFFVLLELVKDTISYLSLFFLLQIFVNWVCYTSRVIILLYSITVFYSTGVS